MYDETRKFRHSFETGLNHSFQNKFVKALRGFGLNNSWAIYITITMINEANLQPKIQHFFDLFIPEEVI